MAHRRRESGGEREAASPARPRPGRSRTPRRGALRDLVRGEGRIERLVTEDGLRDLARWQDPGPVASLYLSMFDDRGSRRGPEPLSTAFRSLRRAALEAYRGYLASLTKPEARRLDADRFEGLVLVGTDTVRPMLHEELAAGDLGLHSSRGHLASGLEEVVEAANLFLARRLVVVCDAARAGFVCRRHQHMSLEPGRCPYDDEELRPVADAGEELIHLAYLSGTERMLVTERPDLLEPYGGAAAVLHAPPPGHSARVGDGP